jgi:hypothetical protein
MSSTSRNPFLESEREDGFVSRIRLETKNTVQHAKSRILCWTVFLNYVTNPGPSNAPETAARITSAITSG